MALEKALKKEQLEADPQILELRKALVHTQKQLAKIKGHKSEIGEAITQAVFEAMLAMGPIKPVPPPKLLKVAGKTEVVLLHSTDWQGGKVTATYNSEIMRRRVMEFAEKSVRITEMQRKDHPVKDCVVMFGGDMIEGLFNYPAQLWEIDSSLFGQYTTVSKLLVDFVRYILANFEKVTVVAEWGNHGRLGNKRDHVPRSDNLDRMIFELSRQLLAGEKRLTWEDSPNDVQRVEIGNYRALLMHGDEAPRGLGLVQHANRWRSGAYPWEFRDVYVGHWHTHNEMAMANGTGAVYQTGSTESDNLYANIGMAASATPSQRLHFIDPIKGRVTANYKIWLD